MTLPSTSMNITTLSVLKYKVILTFFSRILKSLDRMFKIIVFEIFFFKNNINHIFYLKKKNLKTMIFSMRSWDLETRTKKSNDLYLKTKRVLEQVQ